MTRCAILAAMFVLLAPGTGLAQTLIDPGVQLLKQQEQIKALETLKTSTPGAAIAPATPIMGPPAPEKCFKIADITVDGVTLLKRSVIDAIVKPHNHTCMDSKSVQGVMQEITGHYGVLGYITSRVYIPKQDLATGHLKLLVVEGKIEAIQLRQVAEGQKTPASGPQSKIQTAFPTAAGAFFNLRDIEQGLDQINRLPSSKATVDLVPGKTPGASTVVITEKTEKRLRATAGADNGGSDATGVVRLRAGVELDDPFGFNEAWALNYSGSANTNALAGNYSIPFGYWTFSTSGSYSENQQGLTDTTELFDQTASSNLKLEKLAYRDATTKIRVSGSLSQWWNSRVINAAELTPQKRGAARLAASSELHLPTGVLYSEAGATLGIPAYFGDDMPANTGPTTPNVRFFKLDGALTWLQPVAKVGRLSVTAQGQVSPDILLSPDQISIGGWDSVRGLSGASASGDSGVYVRSELVLDLPSIKASKAADAASAFYEANRTAVEPYLFLDAGYVASNAAHQATEMIGAGAGLRLNTDRLKFDLAVASPLAKASSLKAGDWQSYGTLTLKLY
jgi:hemolysin activation/secretion protein